MYLSTTWSMWEMNYRIFLFTLIWLLQYVSLTFNDAVFCFNSFHFFFLFYYFFLLEKNKTCTKWPKISKVLNGQTKVENVYFFFNFSFFFPMQCPLFRVRLMKNKKESKNISGNIFLRPISLFRFLTSRVAKSKTRNT